MLNVLHLIGQQVLIFMKSASHFHSRLFKNYASIYAQRNIKNEGSSQRLNMWT